MRNFLHLLFVALLLQMSPGRSRAQTPPPGESPPFFQPTAETDLRALRTLVAAHSPELQQPALSADLAAADLRQAGLFDNPSLDFSVGTLPLGTPNPPDLPSPLTQIPNYNVGLGLHPDLFRRGPRIARAASQLSVEHARLQQSTQERALALARLLGAVASVSLRRDANRGLAEEARALLAVARSRAEAGFGTPIDADRAEIDMLRLEQQVLGDESLIRSTLADCTASVGMMCLPFASSEAARSFLESWFLRIPESAPEIEQRADLRALASSVDAAHAEERLARAQALPDPTLRVGYTYDSFVISGNQLHSMNVALSLPLPLFDHGQAQRQAARARGLRFGQERQLRLAAAQARIESLRQVLVLQQGRRRALQQTVLPRAREVVRSVNRAYESRAIRITELIQARRSLFELAVSEAESLAEVYETTLDLLAELPANFDNEIWGKR